MKRFIDLAELTREEIEDLLARGTRLEKTPDRQALAGRVLGLLFFNPSLRTLSSFQSGMARLGGSSFVLNPGSGTWALETRRGAVMDGVAAEHIREAIPVLAGYADALGIRCRVQADRQHGAALRAEAISRQISRMRRFARWRRFRPCP